MNANNNNNANKKVPAKEGDLDPTEFTESMDQSAQSQLEIAMASPDSNYFKFNPDAPIPVEDLSPRKRYARFGLACCILVAVIAGCTSVLVVLLKKYPVDYNVVDDVAKESSNPDDNAFPPPPACTKDAYQCPDGTFVGRDETNNCEFRPCPTTDLQGEEPETTTTTTTPPTTEPPTAPACPREVKMCTDLTTVTRTGANCEFEACPAGACMVDSMTCPDGTTTVGRDPDHGCEFLECPTTPPLAEGECPEGINPREIKLCPDLSTVTRSGPNCEFELCPP